MRTILDVYNAALIRVGSPLITNANGIGPIEDICRSLFPQARDEVLRVWEWPSATKRAALTLINSGDFDPYPYAYMMPIDLIFLRGLIPDTARYLIEGKTIFSDTANAAARYIYGATNPDVWDPLLATAVCLRLASHLAIHLVHRPDIQAETLKELQGIIQEAMNSAGQEAQNKQPTPLFWDEMVQLR